MIRKYVIHVFVIFVLLCYGSILFAGEKKKNMGGWERDSEYNKLYDATEMDSFKGWVIKVKEVVPIPGMSPGVAVEISETKDLKSESIVVQLCPTWFADAKSIGLRRGERVKVKGAWAEVDGEDVFLASKIKKGDYYEFKARLTKDGTPFWTMSPEELAEERALSQASLKKGQ